MGHRWKGLAETFKHENGLANPKMFITDQLVAFLENSEISMTQKSLQKKSQDVHQLHPKKGFFKPCYHLLRLPQQATGCTRHPRAAHGSGVAILASREL